MPESAWLRDASPAFQLMIATSWIAPDSCREDQDGAVHRAGASCRDWTEYLRLVDRHRTPALSWAALKRVPTVHIPEQLKRELQKRSDICRLQAMLHLPVLAGVLKGFNQSGIPVMPLKGPVLSLALYGDAGLRQSKDLDILVPQNEILHTQECLEKMGWRLAAEYFSLSPRQWKRSVWHEHHIGYVHPQQGCRLELHWRSNKWYTPQETEHHWARSRTAEFFGFSYRAMSAEDLAIYLCNHGGGHGWFRAKWLGDLARMHCGGLVDWPNVLAYARASGQERSVLLCLQLLSEGYDLAFPNIAVTFQRLPGSLTRKAVRELTARRESSEVNAVESFKEKVRNFRYFRRLWPHRSWWKNLAAFTYCRLDFKVLRLPDRFFWLYIPLRPFLSVWRRRRGHNPTPPLPPVSRLIRPK